MNAKSKFAKMVDGCAKGSTTNQEKYLTCLVMALAVVWCAAFLPAQAFAQSSMLIAPVTPPGPPPYPTANPALRFQFVGTGPLTQLSDIPASALNDPSFAAFSTGGELFISNRHGDVGMGLGSIARFTFDEAGNFLANGVITGNSLEAVHGLAFSPTGELFAANAFNGTISRFLFDSEGNAIANGTIITGLANRALAFSSGGELFVTSASSIVTRFQFDPVTGAAIPNGSFAIPGSTNLHGLTFSASGELFVADPANPPGSNLVFRVLFDDAGNPVSNGTITVAGAGGVVGVAFSSAGELFVTSHFSGGIWRFLFDESGSAIPNGSISTPTMGGPAIFP